jgi:hypothetical protein
VTPPDFDYTITSLNQPLFFPSSDAPSRAHLVTMVKRWESHVESGKFELSVPKKTPLGADHPRANFWTTPFPFWDMEVRDPVLFGELKQSGLVIFKVRRFGFSRLGVDC